MVRFDKDSVRGLLKRYGVRSGLLWYFRDGLFLESQAEKPPYIYLKQRLNEKENELPPNWSPVNSLSKGLLEMTGLGRKRTRVTYDGPADVPRMYLGFDANDNFGFDDTRLTVGVFLQFQVRKGGRFYGHWSSNVNFVRACELVAMGRSSGDEFLAQVDKHCRGNDQLWQHSVNVRDYRLGILA